LIDRAQAGLVGLCVFFKEKKQGVFFSLKNTQNPTIAFAWCREITLIA